MAQPGFDKPAANKKKKTPRDILSMVFKPRNKPPNYVLSVATMTIKMVIILVCALAVGGVGLVMGIAQAYIDTTPDLDLALIDDQAQTSYIYDVNGDLITDFKGTENRVLVKIEDIPEQLQEAFIAIEDTSFKTHNGIDIKRIVGAFIGNVTNGNSQGGSTITQQLIKNTVLDDTQSYKRKLQEARLAMELEKRSDKDSIMEYYLNTIHLGENSYGVKAAAMNYFGKELDQLTLREMACLAGINKSPNGLNPRRNYVTDPSRAKTTDDRINLVLMEMYKCDFITYEEMRAAQSDTITVAPKAKTNSLYAMPYAVEYAIYDASLLLCEQKNLEKTSANQKAMEAELRTRGYNIYTTIDPTLQDILETTIYEWKDYPKMKNPEDRSLRSVSSDGMTTTVTQQPQCAAAVIDWREGEFRAVVGGRDAPTGRKQFNRAYQAKVGVGSSIKPLTCYTPAMDKGLSPASPMINLPSRIPGWVSDKGYPSNFSSGGYGLVPMRTALVKSLNIVAAHLLLDTVTLDDAMKYLQNLGIDTSSVNKGGSDLALGTGGIALTEMTAAYGTLANKGEYQRAIAVKKITDSSGQLVLDAKKMQADSKTQVYKPGSAYMMIDMMTDGCKSGGTGARASAGMKVQVAGKTGTNTSHKGVFFAGVTPYYAACVWIGHDKNLPLGNLTGGADQGAAPLWNSFMKKIHAAMGYEDGTKKIIEDDPMALGLIQTEVCAVSGQTPSSACYERTTDWMNADALPDICQLHESMQICSVSYMRVGAYCPSWARTYSSVIAIPKDHPLAKIESDVLREYVPLAKIINSGTTLELGTCNVHTSDWVDYSNQPRDWSSWGSGGSGGGSGNGGGSGGDAGDGGGGGGWGSDGTWRQNSGGGDSDSDYLEPVVPDSFQYDDAE